MPSEESPIGGKHQQFYSFAVNRESARDVYSKRRIIAVIELKIVEWHNYKHLYWIMVRRDDDKLYKFKKGEFKRLRIQDIEDITIIIQRRVEDLQLSVESFHKKHNLTKPDTYRSDLKRKESYSAYSNPRGFIYQNKDKQNRLMQIDELHKFSDGTLTDVLTALDDRLKGIRMNKTTLFGTQCTGFIQGLSEIRAHRSFDSRSVGVAKDVFIKVGTFHFPTEFVVVDFDADPRVPLILRRSFLKTRRALIDVFEGELTLRVGKEAITFNLDQTSRYSANYNDMTAKRIDVIDMACKEYSQEVLGFSEVIAKVDAFLALEDDLTSLKVDQSHLNYEGDILLLEAFLNDDPSLPP
nr:reverse transcriptase domain-containing protein [Tanacetum cinerariifolium]